MKTLPYEGVALRPKKNQYYMVGQSQDLAYANRPTIRTSGITSLKEAIQNLCEGGYVVDSRHLSWEMACKCISGPTEDVSLPPLTIRPALANSNRTFSSMEEFFDFEKNMVGRSVAYFSMDLYAEWWRRLGSKIGRKVKGQIVWKSAYAPPMFP